MRIGSLEPCQAITSRDVWGFKHRSSLRVWMSRESRIFDALFPSDLRVWMVFVIYNQKVMFALKKRLFLKWDWGGYLDSPWKWSYILGFVLLFGDFVHGNILFEISMNFTSIWWIYGIRFYLFQPPKKRQLWDYSCFPPNILTPKTSPKTTKNMGT